MAKMNVFEIIYYRRERLLYVFLESLKQIKEGFILIGAGLINFIMVVIPVFWFVGAYLQIRNSKKEMDQHNKYK